MKRFLLSVACLAMLAFSQNASACVIDVSNSDECNQLVLKDFEGRDTEVTVDITRYSDSSVGVTAYVSDGIADLQGLFFNLTDTFAAGDLNVYGRNVTSFTYSDNNTVKIGGGVTMSGAGKFDLGVQIGTPGIGKDDISSVSFTIESLSNKAISFTDLFGARLTSVGANRQDSRKLVGLCETPTPNPTMPPAAVPEPTTLLLLSAGVLGFAGLRKKFRR